MANYSSESVPFLEVPESVHIHPDVLAAHAQFGGDILSMQAMYDRPKHLARIKELEKENTKLRLAVEAGLYKGWFSINEETGVHGWSESKPSEGLDIRKATIDECLKYLTNPKFVKIYGMVVDDEINS